MGRDKRFMVADRQALPCHMTDMLSEPVRKTKSRKSTSLASTERTIQVPC
jgi:hypothetical protein